MTKKDGNAYIRGLKAGRKWAATHPDAEREVYEAKAEVLAKKHGEHYARGWEHGLLCEYWKPTLDQDGQPLPDTRSYC